ncbi:hypothetical protein NDU88_005682 [Pleurodeles waltl]|uniref:Prolactin receptor n=1 Tax=Pleurodeles waltl TaxID=8319 RepID=A0AAV7LNC3_PLEWA|nr:hypothetical protein NDU88_005682 [Pleurodeles waltl]
MEAHKCSSTADSDDANALKANERLYLMTDSPAQERAPKHVQLVDKQQIKKTTTVDLQVQSHTTHFILYSGATCNIMYVS